MRYAFTTTVKDGKMEEYLHYHDHIWPEVCRGLRAADELQFSPVDPMTELAERWKVASQDIHRFTIKMGGLLGGSSKALVANVTRAVTDSPPSKTPRGRLFGSPALPSCPRE